MGWAVGCGVCGAVPTLTGVTPGGVGLGGSVPVKFAGKLDGEMRRVWCDDPQVVFTVPDAAGASVVTVAAGTRPGVKWVRLVNAEGASPAVRFVVSSVPRVDEKEPNDESSAPQVLGAMPAWVHGQLDKAGDVDGFGLKLRKGVPVWIRVDGYSLGSGVDLMMHVVNPRGERVATLPCPPNVRPADYGRTLYAQLRRLDKLGVSRILVESVPDTADWDAVRDRLSRAAATFQ